MIDGFDEFPEALWHVSEVTVVCEAGQNDAVEACDGWQKTVQVDPMDITMDSRGMLHFSGDVPTECGHCGNPHHLSFNGVEVLFDR